MKKLLFCLIMLASSALSGQSGNAPELLAPDILSTIDPEFATTYMPDGGKVYFNRTTPDRSRIFLMESTKVGNAWSTPRFASFTDTAYREIDPFIAPDGKHLFFTSNRPIRDKKDYNIWVCENKNGQWGSAVPLGEAVNSGGDEIYTTVSSSGTLYFSRFTGNKSKIFKSEIKKGIYQPAVQVVLPISDTISVSNPCISPDEKWFIFASGEMRGLGGADLYICGNPGDGVWSTPSNLTLLNSKYGEFAPSFSADGKYLYFTSECPGMVKDFPEGKRRPGDLYRISWQSILMNFAKKY